MSTTLIVGNQSSFGHLYGSSGLPYRVPDSLQGGQNLGFMFLPNYRAWVIAFSVLVCLGTCFIIERTRLGAYLRAATENPTLVRAFGINVPTMITLTYGVVAPPSANPFLGVGNSNFFGRANESVRQDAPF
jgi:branched-subunit amino acid ABC-type transport system permease component